VPSSPVYAEISFRCPDGEKTVEIVGPTADAAIRRARELIRRPRAANIPRLLASRCVPTGAIRLIRRGPGAVTEMRGAPRRRKKRRK
jgi:hypothetical protein